MAQRGEPCKKCSPGQVIFNSYCGAQVCTHCHDHPQLARCYCGWSRSGGDGRKELEEMGEVIDDE